jgi:hypothetical protein
MSSSPGPPPGRDEGSNWGWKETHNIFQRYQGWAGTRSIIFQSLLLGWTAFVFLGTCGVLFASVAAEPENRRDESALAGAVAMLSCCSCGGYFLVAFPLGIAAIATLESRKTREMGS